MTEICFAPRVVTWQRIFLVLQGGALLVARSEQGDAARGPVSSPRGDGGRRPVRPRHQPTAQTLLHPHRARGHGPPQELGTCGSHRQVNNISHTRLYPICAIKQRLVPSAPWSLRRVPLLPTGAQQCVASPTRRPPCRCFNGRKRRLNSVMTASEPSPQSMADAQKCL